MIQRLFAGVQRFLRFVRKEVSQTSAKHGLFLKLVALGKFLRGIFYTLLALGLLALVGRDVEALLRRLFDLIKVSQNSPYVVWILERAEMIDGHMIILASILALFYGITGFLQAIGLHYRRRWAEYITALAAAMLVPGEIYLLIKNPTFFKAFLLVSNLVIVGYLVHVKGLFIGFLRSRCE